MVVFPSLVRRAPRRFVGILGAFGVLAPLALAQGLTPTFSNVAYGPDPLETLDVYRAPGLATSAVLVEVHPGGWAGGSKSNFTYCGDLMNKIYAKGISIVSINYPVAPQATFPVPNISCQRAVQFIRSMAAAWNVAPNEIGIFGTSSGGHLAAWVAMAPDAADPSSADPVLHYSSRVQALVLRSGPTDLTDAYYVFDPNIGHGTSPAWAYFGVANEVEYAALPTSLKQAASPHWLASNAGVNDANKNVAFLGLNYGDPTATSSAALTKPAGDLHTLLQGMILLEELQAIGNTDATLYIAPAIDPSGGVLPAGSLASEWLAARFGGGVRNRGFGLAGCYATQFQTASGAPILGSSTFTLDSYDSYPGFTGLLLVSELLDPAGGTDYYGVGIPLLLNPFTPNLLGATVVADGNGFSSLPVFIPSDPILKGATFYVQSAWVWPPPGAMNGCSPSPLHISTTNLLELTLQ
jgi:hypothetical protein